MANHTMIRRMYPDKNLHYMSHNAILPELEPSPINYKPFRVSQKTPLKNYCSEYMIRYSPDSERHQEKKV